ncbi:hypothetical protein VC83_07348 [Pseudogymnoascus destructans]|uniref:Uncharacterized protein n=1 Tax=Pseudogymnoascus destructans TaxID=655981 RepID=A0A177A5A8_9PEZI|nr:uncharacterized protein VC83_07348 [Pseudogymnoascus destructans]OAF56672.1 hypothetical protein VC83_07348 [Pseudogymnoascus destructans]
MHDDLIPASLQHNAKHADDLWDNLANESSDSDQDSNAEEQDQVNAHQSGKDMVNSTLALIEAQYPPWEAQLPLQHKPLERTLKEHGTLQQN